MSVVQVTDVQLNTDLNRLTDPFEFVVTFEASRNLQDDLDWKLIYVGDPTDTSEDQELECITLGPITAGNLRFTMQADAPDFAKIDQDDIHGMTVSIFTLDFLTLFRLFCWRPRIASRSFYE